MKKSMILIISLLISILCAEEIYIGNANSVSRSSQVPFNYLFQKGISQTIYLDSQIPISGQIEQVTYQFRGNGNVNPTAIHKIWMATTNAVNFPTNTSWIPYDTFTLVFEGTIPTNVSGDHFIQIPLDEPFAYSSGNLVVMTERQTVGAAFSGNTWHVTDLGSIRRTIIADRDEEDYDVENLQDIIGILLWASPNITLHFKTTGMGHLSGIVTAGVPALPVENATIRLEGTNRRVFTNANGEYLMPFIDTGNISVTASYVGFIDDSQANILITENETTNINFFLEQAIVVNISGRVLASDTSQPMQGATVTLSGYANFPPVQTDALGHFNIPGVFANQTYILRVSAAGYFTNVINPIIVEENDIDLADIFVLEQANPPRSVTVIDNGSHATINWVAPLTIDPNAIWFTHLISEEYDNAWGGPGFIMGASAVHRWTPELLQNAGVSGMLLSRISFYAGLHIGGNWEVRVWKGGVGNPLNPGTLIHSQTLTEVVSEGWNEIELDADIIIPYDEELWFGYHAVNAQGYPFATADPHQGFHGYGYVVYINGMWQHGQDMQYGINENWMIKGMATPVGNASIRSTPEQPVGNAFIRSYSPEQPVGNAFIRSYSSEISSIRPTSAQPSETNLNRLPYQVRTSHSTDSRPFESYNIYRSHINDINNPNLWVTVATGISTLTYDDHTWLDTTPMQTYRYIVRAVYTNNNLSAPALSNPVFKTPENSIYIGNASSNNYQTNPPFNLNWRSSLAQSIYRAEDISIVGEITDIAYTYRSIGDVESSKYVEIYMANVPTDFDVFSSNSSWLPYSQFDLVFQGEIPVNLPPGIHQLPLELQFPFNYLGGNLVVYTFRQYDNVSVWDQNNGFLQTTSPDEVRTLVAQNDNSPGLNPQSPPLGSTQQRYANILLAFKTEEMGHISGTVTSSYDNMPLENVEISLHDTHRIVFTNALGEYNFQNIPAGNAGITAKITGFVEHTIDEIEIIEGQTSVINIALDPLPYVIVTGRIIASDTMLPIESASVRLTGYADHETVFTDSYGVFVFNDVYILQAYNIISNAFNYDQTITMIELETNDFDAGDIILNETSFPVRNLRVKIDNNLSQNANITWDPPHIPNLNETWLAHSEYDFDIGVGVEGGAAIEFALIPIHRYTQAQLQQLGVSGGFLTRIDFFPNNTGFVLGTASFELKVYTGGTGYPMNPGTEIYSQLVPDEDIFWNQWNEITLNTPVQIPNTGEFWFGYQVFVNSGSVPSVSTGAANPGFGDVVFWDNGIIGWSNLASIGINSNWMIRGLAYNEENRYTRLNNSRFQDRALHSYNIYRSENVNTNNSTLWSFITNTTATEFTDNSWNNLDFGQYRYIVTSVFTDSNESEPKISSLQHKLPEGASFIGDYESEWQNANAPINYNYRTALVQTIYLENEFNTIGYLTDITYRLNVPVNNQIDQQVPVKIWVGTTLQNEFLSGSDWIPMDDLQLVYDGVPNVIGLQSGWNDLKINFDFPYYYTDKNLVIMTQRMSPPTQWWGNYDFQNTPTSRFRTMWNRSDSQPVNPISPPDANGAMTFAPNVVLQFGSSGLGRLEGVVTGVGLPIRSSRTDMERELIPLESVEIRVIDTNRITLTNAEGQFYFDFLQPGVISLLATKHGYFEKTIEDIIIIEEETSFYNFDMTPRPTVKVSGMVISSANNAPVINANISLTGYHNYNTETNENGEFLFENVFANFTYSLSIEKEGHDLYLDELVSVGNTDLNLETIILWEHAYPPINVLATEQNDSVLLSWEMQGSNNSDRNFSRQATRIVEKFIIYRSLADFVDDTNAWEELSDDVIDLSFTDNSWENIPYADYIYIVKAEYTNSNLSIPAFSNIIKKTTDDIDRVETPLTNLLYRNYPNPFNPTTTIYFDVAEQTKVTIEVYNITGQRVKTLINQTLNPGAYSVVWNGNDHYGRKVASGMYFYQMKTDNYSDIKRMVLMK